jgi:hypothetical protein
MVATPGPGECGTADGLQHQTPEVHLLSPVRSEQNENAGESALQGRRDTQLTIAGKWGSTDGGIAAGSSDLSQGGEDPGAVSSLEELLSATQASCKPGAVATSREKGEAER